ncbi:MAG: acetylxylan esterase [Pseudonocardiaceae bacterium]|nr:acetylxylan esterase [Pseudonocardiaceae bacterium]
MFLRRLLVAVSVLLATTVAVPASVGSAAAADPYESPGPYDVTVEIGVTHTIYRPADLGTRRHPVIIWGNGTGAVPGAFSLLLRHWASHGFVVAAANTPLANSGQEMLAGARWLISEDNRPGSGYFRRIDGTKIGAAGHSQGGAGAVNAGADPLVDTTIPLQPGPLAAPGKLRGPALFLAGQRDSIVVPWLIVVPMYQAAAQVPAVYGELGGANHFEPVIDGGGYRGMMTAWFRFHLMGDEQARSEFFGPSCGPCADPAWTDVRRNAKARQIPG